jgi:3-oxoacyl-[acyl-carrier protein] reductase
MGEKQDKELAGRIALVTGAAKNIGRSIALTLADGGATVAVNTRASRDDADKVAQEICAAGGKAQVFMADIRAADQVKTMVDGVIKEFGKIDVLVLNASVRREVPFVDMDFEEWRSAITTSLDGSFHCIKACLPSMIAGGGGTIVTLAGDNALSGAVGKAHSSAAKNGLVGLTRALAKELAQHNIRVNCVSPGAIETSRPAYRAARPDPGGRIPMGRRGKPEEIAAVVRFLCGPGAGYITGQTVSVNGGIPSA